MKIELIDSLINTELIIDGKKESDLTYEEKLNYFFKIRDMLPDLDPHWFTLFMEWVCFEFGEFTQTGKIEDETDDLIVTHILDLDKYV